LVEIARQERAEKIAKIEEENESLKARIKLMEEGKNEDLTQLVGQRVKSASTKEIEGLLFSFYSFIRSFFRFILLFNHHILCMSVFTVVNIK